MGRAPIWGELPLGKSSHLGRVPIWGELPLGESSHLGKVFTRRKLISIFAEISVDTSSLLINIKSAKIQIFFLVPSFILGKVLFWGEFYFGESSILGKVPNFYPIIFIETFQSWAEPSQFGLYKFHFFKVCHIRPPSFIRRFLHFKLLF